MDVVRIVVVAAAVTMAAVEMSGNGAERGWGVPEVAAEGAVVSMVVVCERVDSGGAVGRVSVGAAAVA